MNLILTPNVDDPDALYQDILRAHEGLDAEESAALNARLVLVLANHIGDPEILRAALAAAEGGGEPNGA